MNPRLESAGNRLEAALDRYFKASLALQQACAGQGRTSESSYSRVLVDQLHLASQFEEKIQRARAASGFTRNCSSPVARIHSLSPNILASIFSYFVATEKCQSESHTPKPDQLPRHPIYLTHICTHWRRIAIDMPWLWSHIDISTSLLNGEKSSSRIHTFLLRAGHSPLDLHIHHTCENESGRHEADLVMKKFVAPLIPRMQGLACNIDLPWSPHSSPNTSLTQDIALSILSQFLNEHTTSGTFSILDTSIDGASDVFYIQTTQDPEHERAISLNIPAQRLDDLLLPVTILRLSKIVPHWTSKAFHSLIELRLQVLDNSLIIHDSQLASILARSPQLRILELDVNIEFANVPIVPVGLHDLRVLITHFSSYSQLGRFLHLLDTGSSPLFVSIDHAYLDSITELDENVVDFFSRSNVSGLSAEFDEFCMSLQLVTFTHTIRKLAINYPGRPWRFYNRTGANFQVRLEALYLLRGFEVDINELRAVGDWSGVRKLVIWGRSYQITHDGRPIVGKRSLQKELADIGFSAEILSPDLPSPIDSFLL